MKKKIMIVDDETDLLKVTCYRIEKSGYDVCSASDGKMALEVIAKECPDLVLLDIRLPELNGPEVCVWIKKDEKLKHIPVVLFTASTQNIEEKAAACGAEDYITKPFSSEELLEKIKKYTA